jgi:hypothetical protein
MKQLVFKRGNLVVLQGIVNNIQEGTGGAKDMLTTVSIESDVYSKSSGSNETKTAKIAFWNYKNPSGKETKNATNAKTFLKEGDFISLMATEKDGKYTGIAFKKNNALWHFPADPADPTVKEYNVFVGTLAHGVLIEDDATKYITSMRIDVGKGESKKYSMTFWNNTGKQEKLAENARKCLSPYKAVDGTISYKRAAIVCDKINTFVDSSGEECYGAKAYSFDRS